MPHFLIFLTLYQLISLSQILITVTIMSSRKSSLRLDRTLELLQPKPNPSQHCRQRKNSTGITRPNVQHIHNTTHITLDEKLTQKLVLIKKVQKLQKQSIKHFYNNCHQQCFSTLEKCLNLLQLQASNQMSFVEHFIYIRYLQGEFKYKLRMFGDAREFYEKAVKISNRLNKVEREKNMEYLASLQALNANLQYEEGKFGDSIRNIQHIEQQIRDGTIRLNQKTVKQLSLCKIQSLLQLNRFQQSKSQIQKFQTSYKPISYRQHYKLSTILATCQKHLLSLPQSQPILQSLIQFFKSQYQQKSQTNISQQLDNASPILLQIQAYISKCYAFYVDFVQDDVLKAIYLCKRWRKDCGNQDHATAKLCRLYTGIGDYQSALAEFAQIGEDYRRSAEDWEALAQIKQYYAENQATQHMLSKALQTSKTQQQKMKLQLKLLYFCPQPQRKQAMKTFQKKIKDSRIKKWIQPIIQKYGEFLTTIGEQSRFQKITKLISFGSENNSKMNSVSQMMMQTGKFGSSSALKQQNSNVMQSRIKKGYSKMEKNR